MSYCSQLTTEQVCEVLEVESNRMDRYERDGGENMGAYKEALVLVRDASETLAKRGEF